MLLLMIERGMPIDMVLTADTGMEFPEEREYFPKKAPQRYGEIRLMNQEKKMTVLRIDPNKVPSRVELGNDLRSLQKAVGGYIEAVYPFDDPVALVVNDEGKLNGLPLNRALRDEDGHIYDVVAGSFLVVGLGESDFTSLSPELMGKYEKLWLLNR